jgi:helix-turn-helix protein
MVDIAAMMTLPDFNPLTVPADQIPAALVALAAQQSELAAQAAALAARLLTPTPASEAAADEADHLLTTVEAAAILRRSVKWLYRHQKNLPFARKLSERSWVFSEQGLRRWLARQRA